ncbi:Ig-like domain-containing protein [Microbispora sp. H11081]|uniref:Ig-like domain-containing protein n=1 Tax=Microbispora sp. H11081 TaxID=2729107 RepID=UPI001474819E|nr:Ig-like domain-containing protein [Microbispora sp. H11081]
MNTLRRAAHVTLSVAALAVATACSAGGTTAPAASVTGAAGTTTQAPATKTQAAAEATATNAAQVASKTARKATKPKLGIADITPMGEKVERVGVGFPIIVTFDRTVRNRAAAEAVLQVQAQKPVEGAWRWVSDRKVIYRTKTYWKPHQKVLFTARLSQIPGNEAAKDVSRRFAVGTANISVVDTKKHVMKVRRDGKLAKTIPISAGSGGLRRNGVDVYLTTSGVHLAMGKKRVETMTSSWLGVTDPKDPLYYKLEIPWAVRISDSGEYVHQSAGDYHFLGKSNQSHGCVRATPAGAKWFYGISQRGDVIEITGTKRKLDWRNGWSYWQLSWNQWKRGSALPAGSASATPSPSASPSAVQEGLQG